MNADAIYDAISQLKSQYKGNCGCSYELFSERYTAAVDAFKSGLSETELGQLEAMLKQDADYVQPLMPGEQVRNAIRDAFLDRYGNGNIRDIKADTVDATTEELASLRVAKGCTVTMQRLKAVAEYIIVENGAKLVCPELEKVGKKPSFHRGEEIGDGCTANGPDVVCRRLVP